MQKTASTRFWWILLTCCSVIIVGGILARLYNLSFPNKQVFDEVYFPVFAQHYIDGVQFFDVHPPFGKFVIAVGMFFVGDNPLGWRIMPAMFGVATIALMGELYWLLFKDKVGALLFAAFIALDGIFIAYSRVGLMDGILFFFIFAAFMASVRLNSWWRIFWLATLIGLAFSIKWPAIAVLAPVLVLAYRQKKIPQVLVSLIWSAVVYFVILYAGQYLTGVSDPLREAIIWNRSALHYHLTVTATHPWSSKWYTWPFLGKPVLFLYDAVSNGRVQVMTTLGNPFLWWSSSIAVISSTIYVLYRKFQFKEAILDHPLTPFLFGYFAFFLPWGIVHRVVFLYHYMPSYGFALGTLVYWLSLAWKKWPQAIIALLVVFAVVSIYFLPFYVGWWPLNQTQIQDRVWIHTWL